MSRIGTQQHYRAGERIDLDPDSTLAIYEGVVALTVIHEDGAEVNSAALLRRDVLKLGLGALAACTGWTGGHGTAPPDVPPSSPLLPEAGDDEAFWTQMRTRFELDPDWLVLATVVRGVTTRAVRERIAAESERQNAFRPRNPPDSEWRERLRGKVAALIGAAPQEVALTRNTTDGITAVLQGWPLNAGDEILTSSQEHSPYYGTLALRAGRDRVTVRSFHLPTPAASPQELAGAVEAALGPRTRLVLLCRVTLTGQILPIQEIAARVHARGARLLVDGALAVGHVANDVHAMGCDFFAGNFHKWACGPRGTGVLYVKSDLIECLPPLYGPEREDKGGSMEKFERFGGHPDAHFIALESALDALQAIGMERIQARLFALTRHWVEQARSIPGIRFAARLEPGLCASLMTWEVEGVDSGDLATRLRRQRIALGRTGRFAGFFGIPEAAPRELILTNTSLFTTRSELDRFVAILRREVTHG
jgi:isopenicillin-N epimerase